jgi:flavin-dependent dehydrogenase
MTDRTPLKKWSFGLVTLIGDAAHPMYPIGANGASQALLDSVALRESLSSENNTKAALIAYEKSRLQTTSKVVLENRKNSHQKVLEIIEDQLDDANSSIDDIVSSIDIPSFVSNYRSDAGFDLESARLVTK